MNLIQQSMLIRDNPDNVFAALTSKEDLANWWGLVNEDADGETVWYGMDRQYAVPIVAREDGKMLAFAFDAHHPYDAERTEPTQITITLTDHGNATVVTIVQSMFGDDRWNELIHDGWVFSLISLQLWVERGQRFTDWMDAAKYHTVRKAVTLPRDAEWAWNALTNGNTMGTWLDGETTSDPTVSGKIRIEWDEDTVVGGEWVLLSKPRNLVSHWWDAKSLEEKNDPGRITIQQWLILPAVEGSVITLTEYGYELATTSPEYIQSIESGWEVFLNNLQTMANGDDAV